MDSFDFCLYYSDIVKGMKIDRSTKSSENISRAQQVRNILRTKQTTVDSSKPKFTRRRQQESLDMV